MKVRKASFVILTLLCAFCFGGSAKGAENWGYLQTDAKVGGKQLNNSAGIVKDDDYYNPNPVDGIDPHDVEILDFLENFSGAVTNVGDKKLGDEYSPNDSNIPKYISFFFNGDIGAGEDPNVTAEFQLLYGGDFGGRRLIATEMYNNLNNTDPNNTRQIELQQKITESGDGIARIVYGKLPEGSYTPDTPFLELRLDFEKLLADFNGDDKVNIADYVIISEQWEQTGAGLQADISGPNNLPDSVVDNYDLAKFLEYWMQGVGG